VTTARSHCSGTLPDLNERFMTTAIITARLLMDNSICPLCQENEDTGWLHFIVQCSALMLLRWREFVNYVPKLESRSL